MKKLLFFIVAVTLMTGFVACGNSSNDEEIEIPANDPEESIIGRWETRIEEFYEDENEWDVYDLVWTFAKDGSFKSQIYLLDGTFDEEDKGKWYVKNDKIYIQWLYEEYDEYEYEIYRFAITDNILTIYDFDWDGNDKTDMIFTRMKSK